MHGGLGHFKALIARRKERQLKQKKKFDKEHLSYISESRGKEIKFPEVSNSKLREVKKTIRKKAKQRKMKEAIAFSIIVASLLFLFLKYIV